MIEQVEHSECGLACVAMIFSLYDFKIKLSHLRNKYGVPNGGYNLSQLSQVLSDAGIVNIGVKIKNIIELSSSYFPMIVHFGEGHFVVAERRTKKYIVVVDPASGRQKIKSEDFIHKFTGYALIIDKNSTNYCFESEDIGYGILNIIRSLNFKYVICVLLLSIGIQLISLLLPNLLKDSIDNNNISINTFAIQIIVSILIYYFLSAIRIITITKIQIMLDKYLLKSIVQHLLMVPFSFFTNRNRGEILFRINSNSYIRQLISESFSSVLVDILFSCIYLYYLFSININLTVVVLIITTVMLVITVVFTVKFKKIQENQVISSAFTQEKITEIIDNISVIKAYGVENEKYVEWTSLFEKQMIFEYQKAKYLAFLGNIRNIFPMFLPIIVYSYGNLLVKQQIITIGENISFNTITNLFVVPIISLGTLYNNLSIVRIYIQKLIEVFTVNKQEYGDLNIKDSDYEISIHNLSFRYNYFSKRVLNNVNLRIKEGEKIAIVGPSGSGKSTLLKLLARLLEVNEGEIIIGGENIKKLSKLTVNRFLGIALQNHNILQDSLEKNIALYNQNVDYERMKKIYDVIGVGDIGFSMRTNMILSENGANLSGGERQRISIGRLLYKNPKILLLDEPTSSLDNISEKKIIDYLLKLSQTCIVISHRFYDIEQFDRIIVLYDGKVVGDGTHHSLVETCDIYKKMYIKN